ncbi:MAG TPA: hypothetical protein VLH81_13490 [Desulfobacterales bacterium]|nr:hypothetical protein [Desulfobacterales bacterium]
MLPFLVPVKILVTVGMVLGLALVAERVSPRVAGVLSGYPLGAAIALFFIGLEIGPQFAADSAVFALAGLTASLAFVSAYYAASARCRGRAVAPATAAALAAYFAAAWALQGVPFSLAGAVLLPAAAIPVFARVFRRVPNVAITRGVRFTPAVLLVRAVLAAAIILAITAAAHAVGPAWAGLFAAFPTALFPLMLIVHLTYGKAHVHTVIKNFPLGLGSLIVYGLTVALGYPRLGVGWGTAAAFAAATAYLVIYGAMVSRRRR